MKKMSIHTFQHRLRSIKVNCWLFGSDDGDDADDCNKKLNINFN